MKYIAIIIAGILFLSCTSFGTHPIQEEFEILASMSTQGTGRL